MALFILVCVVCIVICTKYIYDTHGVVDRGLSFSARFLAFAFLITFGVWFLSKAYHAPETKQIDCGKRHRHRVCDEASDPLGFAMWSVFWFFSGITGVSGGIAVLIGPKTKDGSSGE